MRVRIVLLLLISSVGLAQKKKEANPQLVTLFTISKTPVYTEEFIYLYKKNHTQAAEFTQLKIDEYLNLLINFKLKITEARWRGLDTTAAFRKEYATYKEELKKPYTAGTDDLDRLTQEAYHRLTEEIKAAHILVSVKPDARPADTLAAYTKITGLRARAVAGEDFEKLAKEFSDDPSARANGGNLGYFTALQMVYPFESAAYATSRGNISPIVRTRFGYHIIKVVDRMPARGEVEVSHILLRTGKGNDAKAKNTIFQIYDQLKAGRPWDDLCKEYSEDSNTKNNGGRLRAFGVGALASVPEFEQVAFFLKEPGEISDPFQSNVGWHIIRLEKKIPVPSYKDMEASLKRRVGRDERFQISKERAVQKRKAEFGFIENGDTKTAMLAQADSTLTRGKWKYTGKAEFKNAELFSLQSKKFSAGEFISYAESHQSASALAPQPHMAQLYDKFIEEKIGDIEEQKLLTENPAYRMLLNEYKEGILLFEIMEKEVWNKASEDSVGQRKFYNEHLDKYKAGDRIEARIFSTPDKSFLDGIKNKISKGDTLTVADLKKFKSTQNRRAYERGESKIIDRINWVPGIQEAEMDGMYYLVDVSRLLMPGVKSFGEARASVISDYQDSLEKTWLIQLREKYPVSINKKGKKAVIAELKK